MTTPQRIFLILFCILVVYVLGFFSGLGFVSHHLSTPEYVYRESEGYTLRINARTSETHVLTSKGWRLIAESPEKHHAWMDDAIVEDRPE